MNTNVCAIHVDSNEQGQANAIVARWICGSVAAMVAAHDWTKRRQSLAYLASKTAADEWIDSACVSWRAGPAGRVDLSHD